MLDTRFRHPGRGGATYRSSTAEVGHARGASSEVGFQLPVKNFG
jgi:hypothetical protein